jgi:hypothetical protein
MPKKMKFPEKNPKNIFLNQKPFKNHVRGPQIVSLNHKPSKITFWAKKTSKKHFLEPKTLNFIIFPQKPTFINTFLHQIQPKITKTFPFFILLQIQTSPKTSFQSNTKPNRVKLLNTIGQSFHYSYKTNQQKSKRPLQTLCGLFATADSRRKTSTKFCERRRRDQTSLTLRVARQ